MANKNLNTAKKAKNDEFWTLMPDIEKEVSQYKDQFEDKVIYCNCDDYRWSNFYKYFKDHFKEYKLKRLIASCLTGEYASYDGNVETTGKLQNGDFRKEESIELLKQADIVVTNPPFSLFREYVAQLIKYKKKFLIIGNQNAIAYKEIFPLIKDNKIWLGYRSSSGGGWFTTPKEYEQLVRSGKEKATWKDDNGTFLVNCPEVWFTNIPHNKRNEKLILIAKYDSKKYPKYDNYDAIEVGKVADIPKDYNGVMGVPISFLDKYNPSQFEIIGQMANTNITETNFGYPFVNGKKKYARILIKRK